MLSLKFWLGKVARKGVGGGGEGIIFFKVNERLLAPRTTD